MASAHRIPGFVIRAVAFCSGMIAASFAWAGDADVADIRAVHRHGQTFVTWKDVAEGEEGAKFRYSLYRSTEPITAKNLPAAELCYHGVLNNSARLYGSAFNMKDRLDATKPFAILEEGGKPLPPWSGLAVVTTQKPGMFYYAIVATDEAGKRVSKIIPGRSATAAAVDESVAPIQPIKIYDSKERKTAVAQTSITGAKGLSLHLRLGGSNSRGGGASEWGDYYLFFGTPEMGYRDGLAGVFSVEEHRRKEGNRLVLGVRDAVEHPSGRNAMETYWFGYWCIPQWAKEREPRVYPFTENQLLWIVNWTAKRYAADPERIFVGGSSSGAVGSMNVGFRHPELFAAAYPTSGRVRKVQAIVLEGKPAKDHPLLMADGKTLYYDYVNGPKFAAERHDDLPFLGWACGRNDGYATWPEHIDMVKALTAAHHGFSFAWNNGGHGDGGKAMTLITQYYPPEIFARNRSYPAFGNSSIDQKMGGGDVKDGDLEGGINLGFRWSEVVDEAEKWSVALQNDLAKGDMTVDVTPRRCQTFRLKAGETVRWTTSDGRSGMATVDAHGLVTVDGVRLAAGVKTLLVLKR